MSCSQFAQMCVHFNVLMCMWECVCKDQPYINTLTLSHTDASTHADTWVYGCLQAATYLVIEYEFVRATQWKLKFLLNAGQ